ncbi:hypothetical protein RRG08_000575 [Elysia crispata]|uniref:RING-type domain-containing protein n=1 Tax=Elysia crispata TaxID=231223 RepID=A0AAE1CU64_9GAST|nr:hypothetical protein RRG08_000575 [Elysia crispata]
MGYSLMRFVRAIDQHLRCPICSHALESPVLTPCGHTFCRPCLLTWLRESSRTNLYPQSHTSSFSGGSPGALYNPSSRSDLNSQRALFDDAISPSSTQSQVHSDTEHEQLVSASRSHSQPNTPDLERHRDFSGTCPECRSIVSLGELSQVICVRNLILGLEVTCENLDRGCTDRFPLERSEHHLQTCGFVPVTCFGCQEQVSRCHLTAHQLSCAALRRILQVEHVSESGESEYDTNVSCRKDTDEDFLSESRDDSRDASPETNNVNVNARTRTTIRERSSSLSHRRRCYFTSPPYTPPSNDDTNRNCNKTESDISQQRNKTLHAERFDRVQRRNLSRPVCTIETAESPDNTDNTNIAYPSAARVGSSISTTSPMLRSQAPQQTYQASVALAQAGCAAQVSRLLTRIGALETQVGKLLDDLQEANSKNSVLNIEYRRIQKELLIHRRDKEVQTATDSSPELNFEAPHSSQVDINQLSVTLAQNLLAKPTYIDSTGVFRQLRSCYVDNFLSGSGRGRMRNALHDLHVLLATAYASNWFSPAQRTSLGLWLQHVLLTSRQS